MSTHDQESHLDCGQALYQMMQYVDGELQEGQAELLAVHLRTCGPCLAEHDMDLMVKQLVRRSCAEDSVEAAPPALRTTIMQSITTYCAEIESGRVTGYREVTITQEFDSDR